MDAVLVGHSFIRRLQGAHLPGLKNNITTRPVGQQFAQSLRVDHHYTAVHTYCHGINMIQDLKNLPSFLKNYGISPGIIVLDIGSNDLAHLKSLDVNICLELAVNIADIAEHYINTRLCRTVICHSILPRAHRIETSPGTFLSLVKNVNHFLKQLCDTTPGFFYSRLRGFLDQNITQWSTDGIHCDRDNYQKYSARTRHSLLLHAESAAAKQGQS